MSTRTEASRAPAPTASAPASAPPTESAPAPAEAAPAPPPAASGDVVDLDRLRERLRDAEEMLRAIRLGEVDALVIQGPDGPRTYTLVSADQSYRMLVEQISEAALTLSDEGVVLYSNGCLSTLLGLPKESVPGRMLAQLAPPEQRPALLEMLERARREPAAGEILLQNPEGGAPLPCYLSLSPLETAGFSGICAIATDLTEQKRREQTAAEELLTRAVLEFAGTAIAVCDEDGHIVRANRRATELFGELDGAFDGTFADGPSFAELIAGEGERCDLRYAGADGRDVWLLASARPIGEMAPSAAARWVVTLEDISSRKELELHRAHLLEAEHEARERAEAANLSKTQFLAVMSHELRTPLSAVIGYADLMKEGFGGAPSDTQRLYIERIKASAWHLLGLIEGILTFARVEAGKETSTVESTDVAEIGREAAALVATQAETKGLTLALHAPPTLSVPTDKAKLKQILLNLLSNAIKFTDHGSVELSIARSGAYILCEVCDTGPGIEPGDLERIFEPFVQADQSRTRRAGGSGLGLAIARGYAEMIGGQITVRSAPGQGSTFTVRLPVVG